MSNAKTGSGASEIIDNCPDGQCLVEFVKKESINWEQVKSTIRRVLTIIGTIIFSLGLFNFDWLNEDIYNEGAELIAIFLGVAIDLIIWISGLRSKVVPTAATSLPQAFAEVIKEGVTKSELGRREARLKQREKELEAAMSLLKLK